ncbi:MAG: hypothetical protein ACRD9Y_23200, partial [Blastocatellia bacterium]
MRTQLRHLPFSTNPVSKISFQSVLLAAITLALALVSIEFLKTSSLAKESNSSGARKVKQSATSSSHKLVTTYYSVKGNLKATLMLSNQGPNSMPVQVSLFSRNGFQSDLPAITLRGNEVRAIDLRQHVNPGSSFEEGSVQVIYQGRMLELGGVVTVVDSARSLIFDEELVEPAKAFASARLEGVWWRPSGSTE